MVKGNGGVYPRGKDKKGKPIWEVRVHAGINPTTGKYRTKSARVHGTKAEAGRKLDEMRRELDSGIRFDADRMTLRDFCAEYISNRRAIADIQPETLDTYEQQLKDICDILGGIALKDVNTMMVQNLYPKLKERIMDRNAGKCSGTTLHGYHVTLKAAFKYAVNHDLLLRNPCDGVEAPKVEKADRHTLTVEEAARLQSCLDEEISKAYAEMDAKESRRRDPEAPRSSVEGLPTLSAALAERLILATGLRLGEALVLKWSDMDFKTGILRVCRGRSKKGRIKDTPKTESSNRSLPLDAATLAHLAKWKYKQAILLESTGVTPEWMFCSRVGTNLGTATHKVWWREFKEKYGFDSLLTHELRHTQASLLLENGVPLKTVQDRMGHSDVSTTLKYYAHTSDESAREAANLFGDMLATGKRPGHEARIIEMKSA